MPGGWAAFVVAVHGDLVARGLGRTVRGVPAEASRAGWRSVTVPAEAWGDPAAASGRLAARLPGGAYVELPLAPGVDPGVRVSRDGVSLRGTLVRGAVVLDVWVMA